VEDWVFDDDEDQTGGGEVEKADDEIENEDKLNELSKNGSSSKSNIIEDGGEKIVVDRFNSNVTISTDESHSNDFGGNVDKSKNE
jgi:hypothetical protein